MQKKVTEEEKKQVAKNESLYKWLIGLLVGVIFIALTSFISAVQKKADTDYVDKRDLNLEQKISEYKSDTDKKLEKIDGKIDKLIDMHLKR
jgi:hypothetical protein